MASTTLASTSSSSFIQRAFVSRRPQASCCSLRALPGGTVHNQCIHTRPLHTTSTSTSSPPSSSTPRSPDSMSPSSGSGPRPQSSRTPQQHRQVRTSASFQRPPSHHALSFHWLLRTNIPRRRSGFLPNDIQKRNFFGLGEIIGVLANPGETLRSLGESKKMIDDMRQELNEKRERSQLRSRHTFSKLPGFFPRQAEVRAIERALEGEPSFTVLFGASSVGKTALLREVLTHDKYHVLHFDLRIAGFADLSSLYLSLSQQLEQYFEEIANQLDGYEEFEKEAWGFKHDRLDVERRITQSPEGMGQVKTSDVARLMEIFQSSLLKYWEFEPFEDGKSVKGSQSDNQRDGSIATDNTHVERKGLKSHFRWTGFKKDKDRREHSAEKKPDKEKPKETPAKKMPVIFFDEAHKLPALIQSMDAMKCILDSMLVLTKQDRLCHVIHATSDPFYQTWLRQMNVMQHCKVLTIGDCTKSETRSYFQERILPRVPESLRFNLDFESLYDAFGGKLAHWHDYVTDYVNSGGTLHIKQCSHFLQAHALLNLQLVHSSQLSQAGESSGEGNGNEKPQPSNNSIHPGLGRAGFKIYSPISHPEGPNSDTVTSTIPGQYSADFSAMQLLKVMSKLAQPDVPYLPYFVMCRDLGVRAVDGMVKGRVLDLRWTETVSRENYDIAQQPARSMHPVLDSEETAVIPSDEGHTPIHVSPRTQFAPSYSEFPEEFIGPKLLPTTPIMRYAMREVVGEYEDIQSISEYASLSDVDEY